MSSENGDVEMKDKEEEGKDKEEEEEDEIEDDENNGKLGIAYFIRENGEFGWGETQETPGFDSLEYIKFKIRPTLCLVTYKSDFNFMKSLKKRVDGQEGEENVKVCRIRDFSFDNGRKRMLQVRNILIEENTEDPNSDEWGFSGVNFEENKQMVRAAGGLLSYIQANKFEFGGMNETEVLKVIQNVFTISFEGYMQLDLNTMKALSIFRKENHPCNTMKIGVPKEGLSLFSVLDKTKSKIGRKLLRQWFLSPILDVEEIRKRQDCIEFFADTRNEVIVKEMRGQLRYVRNLVRIIKKFETHRYTYNDWLAVYRTLYCFKRVFECCFSRLKKIAEMEQNSPGFIPSPNVLKERDLSIFRAIEETYTNNVMDMLVLLSNVFDFSVSKDEKRMVIQPEMNPELDEKKQLYNSLDSLLTMVAEQEIQELPDHFPHKLSVAYFPQLGYLIVLQRNPALANPVVEIEGYTYFFMTDEYVYYKNARMREMDVTLGDLHEQIIDIESKIEHDVAQKLLTITRDLKDVTDCCALVDVLLSLAVVARENKYTRPKMSSENVILIKNGRNPIQEKTVTSFIGNDTILEKTFSRVQIVTGPNMSGKSVYLKQVGAIVFMAHLGSFVPAETAIIGLTDRILTRIFSEESITQKHSTFSQDVLQVNRILQNATKKSLVLIDEFGKGTLAVDGLALLSATINHFLELKENSPRVFVSTHYTEMFELKLLDLNDTFLKFLTMNIHIVDNSERMEVDEQKVNFDPDDMVFLYKLVEGKVIPSYGLICASLAGIPNSILSRSEQISQCFKENTKVVAMESEKSKERKGKFLHLIEKLEGLDTDNLEEVKEFMQYISSL